MQSLDIALKGIKAVLIYNMLREGVPKSNSTWEKEYKYLQPRRTPLNLGGADDSNFQLCFGTHLYHLHRRYRIT